MTEKRIAVLGGGLLGCCTALVLASRGARVVLFERNARLVSGTSLHNEGKIHLGYVYAGDRSLATARMVIRGAMSFGPFLRRYLDVAPERVERSSYFVYPVLRGSLGTFDAVAGHLAKVHALVGEASADRPDGYFGIDLRAPLRRWSASEADGIFDLGMVEAVFETKEIAVDPFAIAILMRDRLAATANVEIRLDRTIEAVEESGTRLAVAGDGAEGRFREKFDHVVNALWDWRLAIDATLGLRPRRRWLNRFRYGVRMEAASVRARLPTATLVHGPFGGFVSYDSGAIHLSWYPACRVEASGRIDPPAWPGMAEEPLRSRVIEETIGALARISPPVGDIAAGRRADASVIGGNIFAWGSTDTDDPESELHSRHDIGIVSRGAYHSVDPGKLTTVPYFAEMCADRILPQ